MDNRFQPSRYTAQRIRVALLVCALLAAISAASLYAAPNALCTKESPGSIAAVMNCAKETE
jgi:hypothetical protein